MKRHSVQRTLSLILLALLTLPAVGQQLQWHLVVQEKPDINIPTEHIAAYRQAEEAISSQLISNEYEVADKALLNISRNSDDKQIYGLVGEGVNLALRYQIDISTEMEAVVKKWRFNLSAYLVDLESKKQIETASLMEMYSNVPNNCDQQCFSQWLASKASGLARELGAIFVQKLDYLPKRYHYDLEFHGFVGNELEQVRQHLKQVEGFVFAELTEKLGSRSQWLHQLEGARYSYVSNLAPDELDGALFRQLSELGIPVSQAKNTGEKLVFTRAMPYLWGYLLGLLLALVGIYAIYVFAVLRHHNRALDKLAHNRNAQQWLDYVARHKLIAIPRPAYWHRQEKRFTADVIQSQQMSQQAWLLAEKGDYTQAQLKVTHALELNTDNHNAIELKDSIVNYQRGYDRYVLAKKELHSHPQQAAKLLQEAAELNPHLSEEIAKLTKQNSHAMQVTDAKSVITQAQSALDMQQFYLAYSLVDGALSQFNLEVSSPECLQLAALRRQIDQQCAAVTGASAATGALAGYLFYPSAELQLGRKIDNQQTSFGIGFKRHSRAGKQNTFSRKGNAFFVTDQSSTNGSFYGGQRLPAKQLIRVQHEKLLCTGGSLNNNEPGICHIKTLLAKQGSNALILKLNANVFQFADDASINTAWPSMEEDLLKRWVLLGDVLHIGVDEKGNLDVGCINNGTSVAKVFYDDGFYIAPELKDAQNQPVLIDGYTMYGRVPIFAQHDISICGQSFSLNNI
ncbi:FHA domain-containing protein [Alteromonadaceae bacterium BrNp21-10]|nr:FHA domain-containing protein [Alteromonadaceae bacterium BrNp21-10]